MSLSFKNPYVYIISLGVALVIVGFNFPNYLEQQYLKAYTTMVQETADIDSKIDKIMGEKSTVELSRFLEKFTDERSARLKKNKEVSELKGELNLRIFLSQLIVLVGSILLTLGSTLWFLQAKDSKSSIISS